MAEEGKEEQSRHVGADGVSDEHPDGGEEPAAEFEDALRAGIALFNAGEVHAAHDPWEAQWLPLQEGTDDERFLHGLIQFTAAVYHAQNHNWSGATGLAESAVEYLEGLPDRYRGVDLTPIREYLTRLGRDPECIERRQPTRLTVDGEAIALTDLQLNASFEAADALADEYDRYERDVIEDARRYARAEAGTGRVQWTTFLIDFVHNETDRDLIYTRLRAHVRKRRTEESDVEGLF